MGIHSSFKGATKHARHRSVLKRAERVKKLQKEEKWSKGESVLGLPKVKSMKIKIRKEKTAKKEGAVEGAEGTGKAGTSGTPETKEKTPKGKS
jgi:small basic protein (TIGR04137 family)